MTGLLMSLLVSLSLWAKTYGGPGYDLANSVTQTSDGGCAVAGVTQSFGAGGSDFLVIRLNPDGSVAWAETYGGTGGDAAYSIIQTSDGGFAVAGSTGFGAGGSDFLIIKLNPNGSVAWAKTYGGTGTDVPQSIIQTTDGGYAIAGYSSLGAGNYDFLVLRLNTDGSLAWAKTFGSANYELAYSITQTSDGGYAIAGDDYNDVIVLKLDSDGGFSWAKAIGIPGYLMTEYARSITATPDGGCVVAGHRIDASSENYWDVLMLKLDASGGLSWFKTFGTGVLDYMGYSIVRTSDGGFAVAGQGQNNTFMLLKTNASGTLSWARGLPRDASYPPHSVAQTTDGGFVVAVYRWNSASSTDFLVFKVDANGNYPGCVLDCNLVTANPGFNMSSPSGLGTPSLLSSDPELITSSPTLTITDYCDPLYEDIGEIGSGPRPGITCSLVPGGALFLSNNEMPLRIYASDGRLIYSGKLMKGQNRISLETGVYLWRAGTYKG
ncbi:MAG: delta-60 repeat domain-containing protein, partial [candidate division WOR-3 bacterium]